MINEMDFVTKDNDWTAGYSILWHFLEKHDFFDTFDMTESILQAIPLWKSKIIKLWLCNKAESDLSSEFMTVWKKQWRNSKYHSLSTEVCFNIIKHTKTK